MDLNLLEKSRPFSEKKISEKTESLNSVHKNGGLSILSEANQKILSNVQQSAATLGFISLELENLNGMLEDYGDKRLFACLAHTETFAIDLFAGTFKNCRLEFSQQIGLHHYMLCFTAGGVSKTELLKSGLQYKIKFSRLLNQKTKKVFPLNCSIAVGTALFVPDDRQQLEPQQMAFHGLCAAKKMAKPGHDAESISLHNEFCKIQTLKTVQPVFQPVIALASEEIIGWEALSKGPVGSPFEDPSALYAFAEKIRATLSLDHLCRCLAVQAAATLPPDCCLFINLHYRCLQEPEYKMTEFVRTIQSQGLKNRQVILEFNEKNSMSDNDINDLMKKIEFLRSQGFLVAAKNVGRGCTNLTALSCIRPDFIKMDLSITRRIESNPVNRVAAEAILRLAKKSGVRLIAEGVEDADELSALRGMGVYGGQGFYFAEPSPAPAPISPKVVLKPLQSASLQVGWNNSSPIGHLATPGLVVDVKTSVSQVKKQLGEDSPMRSVVVTEGNKPVGLVMSYSLDRHLSSLYGPSLYYHRSVSAIMDKSPLIARSWEFAESVAKKAMSRETRKVYDDIIVVERERLMGVVSVQRIMDTLAKVQVELAKGANPLTGLPGNVMVEMEIKRREKQRIVSSLLYLDLDNFKVYNDVYGFPHGDRVLKMTAQILKDSVSREGGKFDFIGHIGGDDFFIVTDPGHAESIAETITRLFAEQIPAMYSETDQGNGYITGVSRDGREGKFPFISISIGIIDCTFEHPFSLEEMSERAANVKKYAKSKPGNVYLKDRRPPLGAMPKK